MGPKGYGAALLRPTRGLLGQLRRSWATFFSPHGRLLASSQKFAPTLPSFPESHSGAAECPLGRFPRIF
eukprot:15452941-Alexandrium_andersonii.AAC.1